MHFKPIIQPRHFAALLALTLAVTLVSYRPDADYYPGPGDDWERRTPEQVGMNSDALQEAIDFSIASESQSPRDLTLWRNLSREPHNEVIGPTKARGDVTGIVVRKGYIVAEWGDPKRVDMTFSVSKSFLSTVTGLAWDRGLIRDVHDRAKDYVPTDHFDSEHNSSITWDHLLRQTSEWEGTLWEKPDWADRPEGDDPVAWPNRELKEPGQRWKYNDVRVNLLALAVLHVWRKPLPQVLKEEIMDPIDASNTWRWHGYRNSWVTIDGLRMQSVSGGGHWGGGMFISALDQARFGLLSLRRGEWDGVQLLSDDWIEMATTPTELNKGYGFMNWFLNTDRERYPNSPENAFYHAGGGANLIYVSPDHDLVVVVRWINPGAADEFFGKVLASIDS